MNTYVVFCKELYTAEFHVTGSPADAVIRFLKAKVFYNKEGADLSEKIFKDNLKVSVVNVKTGELNHFAAKCECDVTVKPFPELI